MTELIMHTSTAKDTFELGKRLGEHVPAGTVLALRGDLGAGKTVLAAGLAAGLGVSDEVASPTYIYFRDYPGRWPLCHVDAYRLEGREEDELYELGLDDCFRAYKVTVVEWPDFVAAWLPTDAVDISLSGAGEQQRCVTINFDAETQGWLYEIAGH